MSDVARCPKCSRYFDNSFAVSFCPKCGASIDGTHLLNETFASSKVKASAGEIAQIDSHLALSLLSIIFCFPFSIVAIVFSILTINDKRRGNYSAAISHSALAKKIMIASFIIGGILFGLNFLGRFSR